MAFSYTVEETFTMGKYKAVRGTFTNSSSSGGDIDTGLRAVLDFDIQHTESSTVADEPGLDESLQKTGGTITIVTTADKDGIWLAKGW